MKYCGQCGTQHPDSLRFCTICGADMEQQRTPPPEAVAEAPPGAEAPPSLNAVPTKIVDGKVLELSGGTVIGGRYEVVRRLKQGGMGVVYLARDRQLPRDVALKLLLPTYKHDKQMLSRFRREAEAIARLNHANIVQIFDATEDETFGYFIAMEYVAGGSLDELLKAGGRMDLPRAKELATAILRALTYAHRQRVVHRDLKPSNVLLTQDGAPKVVDFGLAQLRGPSDMSVTGYGMGTPYYMAPEQRRDARNADHRADLYSFGATLYHMVTGSLPSAIRETRIPPELRKVTLACLEEKPENRPFSASEVLQMLQDAQEAPTPAPRRPEEELLEEGKCPACGFMNDPGARFCESCGAGLYEKCPQCEHDLRIGRKFCSRCGLNVPQYKKFLDHVKAAAEQERVGRLSRALKEATAAQELGFDDPAVGELLQRCGAKQAEVKALLQRADSAWRKEEYEAAQHAYQAVLQITPQDQDAVARIAETPGLIRARDIARHLATAEEALQRREFETASREAAAVLEMDAENARAEQIKASAAEQFGRLRQIVARGREALERQQYREAADVLQTALPLASSRREVELRQFLTEANGRRIALEELLVEAREALGLGDYEAAGQHAGKAREIQAFNPDAAEMVQAAGEGQERIEGYLKIARSLLEARRYWAARDEFAKALAEVRVAGARLRNEAEAGHEAAAGRIRQYESAKARAEGLVRRRKFHEAVGIYGQLAGSYPRRSEAAQALESARKGRTRRRTRRAVGSLIAGVLLAAATIAGMGYANWRLVGGGEGHLAVGTERLGGLLLRAIDANARPAVGAPPADANAVPDRNAAFAPVTAEVAAARGQLRLAGEFLFASRRDAGLCVADAQALLCDGRFAEPNAQPDEHRLADALARLKAAEPLVGGYGPALALREAIRRAWCSLAAARMVRGDEQRAAKEVRRLEQAFGGPAVSEGIKSFLRTQALSLAEGETFPAAVSLIDRIRRAGQSDDPNRQTLRLVVDELDAEVAGRWERLVCLLRGDPNAPREAGFAAATTETRRISTCAKGLAAEAARQRYVALADRLGQATGSAWAIWLASGGEAPAATAKLKALQTEFPEHAAFAEAKRKEIKAAWEKAVRQKLQPGTFRQAQETSRELIDHYPEDVSRFGDEIRTEWLAHVRSLADAEMEKPKPEERSLQAAAEQAKGLDSLFPGETDAAKYVRKTETQTRFAIHLDTSARKVPAPGTDFPEATRALADCRKEADAAEAILLEQEGLFDAAEARKLRDQLDAANRKVGAATAATLDKEIDARLAAARQAASGPGADFPAVMADLVKAEGLQVQMGELAEAGDPVRAAAQRTDACRAETGRAWSAAVEQLLAGGKYAEAATQCRQMGTFACFQQASAGLRAKLEQAAWQSPPEHKADLDAHADRGEAALRAQSWSDANTAYTAAIETLGRYRDFCRTNGIAPLADSALDANGAPERSGASAAQTVRRLGCARALQQAKQMHADRKWQPARSALAEGGQLAQASGVTGLEGALQQWAQRLDYRLALEKYEKTMRDARKAKDDGQLQAAIEMFSQADAMMGDVTRKEILAVKEMLDRSPQTAPSGTSWSGVAKANQDGDWHGLDRDRLSPDEKAFSDLWKTPYRLARDPQTGRATLYSCGPNRKDENGSGDDITAGP